MFCSKCGTQNDDNALNCTQCNQPLLVAAQPAVGPQIPNYLVQAIFITVCCCMPGGIVAIVYASQVNTKLQVGDVAGAQAASDNAKMWCWISLGVGIVANVIFIGLQVALTQSNF